MGTLQSTTHLATPVQRIAHAAAFTSCVSKIPIASIDLAVSVEAAVLPSAGIVQRVRISAEMVILPLFSPFHGAVAALEPPV